MTLSYYSKIVNKNAGYLFNSMLIKKDGVPFGNGKDTISNILGQNQLLNMLSPIGMLFVNFLNLFETNHAIKSIPTKVILETDQF